MLIHQPWLSGLGGQQSDIEIHARDMMQLRDKIDELLAFHTGKSKDVIHRDTERDKILSAAEAVEYGLVDKVMVRRSA